jgi:nucleoside-diphosphate kinase
MVLFTTSAQASARRMHLDLAGKEEGKNGPLLQESSPADRQKRSDSMNERTLLLIKPDAVQRGLIGEIVRRFERKGFKVVGMKMLKMTKELAKEHYAHLVSKPFYPDLEKFITSNPIVAMAIEGKDAVEVTRTIVGPTNASKAPGGSIRGDLSNSTSRNVIHASDSKETAAKEMPRFFKPNELFDYSLDVESYLYASDE